MATKNKAILWLDAVQEHDYPAAESYLRLIYDDKHAKQVVNKFK